LTENKLEAKKSRRKAWCVDGVAETAEGLSGEIVAIGGE